MGAERWAAWLLPAALAACAGGKTSAPNAANPERQSEAEYDLARDLFHKGQPRQALEHALKAVDADDGNARALKFAAEIFSFFCQGEQELRAPDCHLDRAEKLAKSAVAADDRLLDARNTLGSILILAKKYDEAVSAIEPLTTDPTYEFPHLAWGNLGWAQVLAGKLDAGIASLQNSITNPRFCVGHFRLGIAYERKGSLPQAETSLTQAVEVEHPDCQNLQEAWEARARVRQRLGKISETRADLERCREIAADSKSGKACARLLLSLPDASGALGASGPATPN